MFIEMVISVAVDYKSDSRQVDLFFYKLPRDINLKQHWFIKTKCRNIQSIQHVRMCHAYCLG